MLNIYEKKKKISALKVLSFIFVLVFFFSQIIFASADKELLSYDEIEAEVISSCKLITDFVQEYKNFLSYNSLDQTKIQEFENTFKKYGEDFKTALFEIESETPEKNCSGAWSAIISALNEYEDFCFILSDFDVNSDGKYTSQEVNTVISIVTKLIKSSNAIDKMKNEFTEIEESTIDENNNSEDTSSVQINCPNVIPSSNSLGRIIDIFPDEALAMVVRDKVGKFSIEQTVTQEELDSVVYMQLFSCDHGNFKDLTGIGYLRNLKMFSLYNNMEYEGTFLPDEFYTLKNLETIELSGSNLNVISEKLGNLINLKEIDISRTEVSALPESIGNLTKLETLDIGNTNITELPQSIWGLSLKTIDMSGLPIK